jgi:hypothetical protein
LASTSDSRGNEAIFESLLMGKIEKDPTADERLAQYQLPHQQSFNFRRLIPDPSGLLPLGARASFLPGDILTDWSGVELGAAAGILSVAQ